MAAKVILKFDVLPEEKERLEAICDTYGITKIDFLRASLALAENDIEDILKRVTQGYGNKEDAKFNKEKFMERYRGKRI